jgi:hypothetical protein
MEARRKAVHCDENCRPMLRLAQLKLGADAVVIWAKNFPLSRQHITARNRFIGSKLFGNRCRGMRALAWSQVKKNGDSVSVAPIVATVITAIFPAIFPAIFASIFAAFLAATVHLAIARCIHILVPVMPHEINRACAGVVPVAVAAPVAVVSGWDAQIDRRQIAITPFDENRLAVVNPGLIDAANFQMPVEAWLSHAD